MVADKTKILTAEQEQQLRQPIDAYVGGIQEKIDALRASGTSRVVELQSSLDDLKRDRIYTPEEKAGKRAALTAELEKAKAVEAQNKAEVSKLIAQAETYLKEHYDKDYYQAVVASCKEEQALAQEKYQQAVAQLNKAHQETLAKLTDAGEIKDEKYVQKNRLFDAKMQLSKDIQTAKDRRHAAFDHKYHLIGVAGLILLAGTDLSIGRMVGMGMTAATIVMHQGPNTGGVFGHVFDFSGIPVPVRVILALVVCIVLCTVFTTIAGFFTAKFKMHPFISTMATMLVIFGLVTYSTKGVSFGAIDPAIRNMIIPQINGFPTIILWAVAAVAVVWFIWNKTTFGKNLFAVGGNPEAASVSGISVFWVTVGAFVLAGVLYGFGSWLECIRMTGSGSAAYGQGWEMDAIAACVVGGVSFTGGIGKISGVVVGVCIFTALTYSLTVLGIDTNLQFVFSGIIILVAVMLDCLKYVQKK